MNLIRISDVDNEWILNLFNSVHWNTYTYPCMQQYSALTYFDEESTRTHVSFNQAVMNLGGNLHSFNKADIIYSSVAKGESFPDTLLTFQAIMGMKSVVIMRTKTIDQIIYAGSILDIPVINAGNASDEHPTQALLDLYTIYSKYKTYKRQTETFFKYLSSITVTFVGDLMYGRTVHSLVQLLERFGVTLQFVSPPELSLPPCYTPKGSSHYTKLTDDVLSNTDVLYMTRVQKERHNGEIEIDMDYGINRDTLSILKPDMIIMHPFPRNAEISTDVDVDSRAWYFNQIKFGPMVRQAILGAILDLPRDL